MGAAALLSLYIVLGPDHLNTGFLIVTHNWMWLKIKEPGQVLIFGSIYQGAILVHVFGERLVRRRGTVITSRLSSDFGGWRGADNIRLTLPRILAAFGLCCVRAHFRRSLVSNRFNPHDGVRAFKHGKRVVARTTLSTAGCFPSFCFSGSVACVRFLTLICGWQAFSLFRWRICRIFIA